MDARRETITEMIDTLNAIPYEPVVIPSDDGLRLRGRYYHQKDGAPVVISFLIDRERYERIARAFFERVLRTADV